MPNLGLPELVIAPLVLLYAALPVAAFVLVFLTYRKVSAIEKRLAGSSSPDSE
jgi:hypothetical protein